MMACPFVDVGCDNTLVFTLSMKDFIADMQYDSTRDMLHQIALDLPRIDCTICDTPCDSLVDLLHLLDFYAFTPLQRTRIFPLLNQASLALIYEQALHHVRTLFGPVHLESWDTPQVSRIDLEAYTTSKWFRILEIGRDDDHVFHGTLQLRVMVVDDVVFFHVWLTQPGTSSGRRCPLN